MRPTSCDLAAQHEAASDSEAAQPPWVLVGTKVHNIISSLLFTNGQLAGTNYLARKGIIFTMYAPNAAMPAGEQWLYPTVTFASPLSWFEKECRDGVIAWGNNLGVLVDGLREALLAVQKAAKKSYDLALSTEVQFEQSVGVNLSPAGTQGPIPAQKIMAWQQKYRLDKETPKCEGDE
eukprot:g9148.t1